MLKLNNYIKELRARRSISQRRLAVISNISFRQIQRLEKMQTDITVKKLDKFLNKFGSELKIKPKEPNWNVLFNFGLPLNIKNTSIKKYSYKKIKESIIAASDFLYENKYNVNYMRNYDSFKALLLALKTHYPSEFTKLENDFKIDFSKSFSLDKIEGRDIKLRNISLSMISDYFKH